MRFLAFLPNGLKQSVQQRSEGTKCFGNTYWAKGLNSSVTETIPDDAITNSIKALEALILSLASFPSDLRRVAGLKIKPPPPAATILKEFSTIPKEDSEGQEDWEGDRGVKPERRLRIYNALFCGHCRQSIAQGQNLLKGRDSAFVLILFWRD